MSFGDLGVEFDALGIGTVLLRNRLRVPENQRAYAWRKEHVQQLFEDLSAAFQSAPSPYFLGTIVLTGTKDNRLEVADGQQRLATTSIFIAAIRDYLQQKGTNGKRSAQKYTSDYLIEYDEFQNDSVPKLILGGDDNEFFLRAILADPESLDRSAPTAVTTSRSNERLEDAATEAKEFVESIVSIYSEAEGIKQLFNWMKFLQERVVLIIIKTPREIDAYKMFETLNDRGLKASQTDILKNFLFSEGKGRIQELSPKWSSMVGKVEGYDEDLLIGYIRHFWISKNGPTRAPDLAEKFKSKISGERESVTTVLALDESANDYLALLQPLENPRFSAFSKEARACIHTVTTLLGIEQVRPLMLAVLQNFSVEEATHAFSKFVGWSVRFLVAGGGGGGVLDRHYGLRAQEISTGSVTTASQLSARMQQYVPNDIQFMNAFERHTVTKHTLARYYLRCLDNAKHPNSHPFIGDFERPQSTVNLEHIMPETAAKAWDLPQETVNSYLKRIGNMCLLPHKKNEQLANSPFEVKRVEYAKSSFLITQEVSDYEQWGPSDIESRQAKLAKMAPKIWSV